VSRRPPSFARLLALSAVLGLLLGGALSAALFLFPIPVPWGDRSAPAASPGDLVPSLTPSLAVLPPAAVTPPVPSVAPAVPSEDPVPAPAPEASPVPVGAPVAVALVGDSLLARREDRHVEVFAEVGLDLIADGLGSRALRYGWICPSAAGRRVVAYPDSPECRRQGLEQLDWWASTGRLPFHVVVALGTNGAAASPASTLGDLDDLRRVLGERRLYLLSLASVPLRPSHERWNALAADWCARDRDCRFLDWVSTPAGGDRVSYAGDGVHLSGTGSEHRARFLADELARVVGTSRP